MGALYKKMCCLHLFSVRLVYIRDLYGSFTSLKGRQA